LNRHGTDLNLRLYVTCFEDGQVYVFDPRVPRLVDVIEVGRGPAGLVFPPGNDSTTMFVVGFGANNISVVDIKPGSATENHVVQRIGFPSAVPR
jgi:DNA-binding beta-propeller fold protein YncE